MSIKIESIYDYKNRTVEVTKIKALGKDKLPEKYINNKFGIYMHTDFKNTDNEESYLETDKKIILVENHLYTFKTYQNRIKFIKKCGKFLKEIQNKESNDQGNTKVVVKNVNHVKKIIVKI